MLTKSGDDSAKKLLAELEGEFGVNSKNHANFQLLDLLLNFECLGMSRMHEVYCKKPRHILYLYRPFSISCLTRISADLPYDYTEY